jgi:hypothetical protein
MAAEPSVECYDFNARGRHAVLFPWVCFGMLVYVVGIPATFTTLLLLNRKVSAMRSKCVLEGVEMANKGARSLQLCASTWLSGDSESRCRPRQVLRHRQGLIELQRQQDLYGKPSGRDPAAATRSSSRRNSIDSAAEQARSYVLQKLALQGPSAELQVTRSRPEEASSLAHKFLPSSTKEREEKGVILE